MMPRARLLTPLFATALAALVPTPAKAQEDGLRGFVVSPALIRERAASGRPATVELTIENFEPAIMQGTIKLDPMLPENGSYRPQAGMKHARDCSTWFGETTQEFQIPARGRTTLKLSAKIPKVPSGPYWCVATIAPRFGNSRKIVFQYQVPVMLFVGTQPRPDLRFTTPNLSIQGGRAAVEVPIDNVGAGFATVGSRIELREAATGRLVRRLQDPERDLYPETKRTLRIDFGPLPDGTYTVNSVTRAGVRNYPALSRTFAVKGQKVQPLSDQDTVELAPVTLEPSLIRAEVPAGARRTMAFRVTNVSANEATLDFAVRSLSQTENGTYELGDKAPTSGLKLELDPPSVTLAPKAAATVRLVAELPAGAAGDHWFGVMVKSREKSKMSEQVAGRINVPATEQPKLTAKSLGFERINGRASNVTVQLQNTGNTALRPMATAEVLRDGVRKVTTLEVPTLADGGILPGSALNYRIPLPLNLDPGTYAIVVTYQFGETLFERLTVPLTIAAPPAKKSGKAKK